MAVIASNHFYTITNHSHFHIQPFLLHKSPLTISKTPLFSHHPKKPLTCHSSSQNYESDHQRWLREEQRWLREEQRWLREEARWNNERQSLLRQISELTVQVQHLQDEIDNLRQIRASSQGFDVDFEVALTKMAKLLEGRSFERISDGREVGSSIRSEDLKSRESVENEEEPPLSSLSSSLEDLEGGESVKEVEKPSLSSSSSSLRVGAEGEEVRVLQEALMKLGFYSGEEDMEYSYFSSDTERAVKTWQATIGVREDGIMSIELLERLHSTENVQSSNPSRSSVKADVSKDKANGAPVNVKEVQKPVEQAAPPDAGIPHNRVFLLGENRWEEPSRLNKGNDKVGSGGKVLSSAPKCLVCRGEGRVMCMECDGSGDPNIEEQFLDWVEDGAKCPYCEGLGYTVCDVCGGKSAS